MNRVIPIISHDYPPEPCTIKQGEQRRVHTLKIPNFYSGELSQEFKRRMMEKGFLNPAAPAVVTALDCVKCHSCVELRINLDKFTASRSHRRLNKINADLMVSHAPIKLSKPHYNLYVSHTTERLNDVVEKPLNQDMFEACVLSRSHMQLLRNPRTKRLLGALYFDQYKDSLYAGTQIFAPQMSTERSLGRYGIFKLCEYGQAQGIKHVYLGSWAKDGEHLRYKSSFRGLEAFVGQQWVDFNPDLHTRSTPPKIPKKLSVELT